MKSPKSLLFKLAGLVSALALLITVVPGVPVAQAVDENDEALWQVMCDMHHQAADDPIVFPGQAGAAHMHSFYGNVTTNANTTASSLMSSRSSCGRNMENTDHSGYWVPSLVKGGAVVKDRGQFMFVYYRRAGGADGPKVQPFPVGLRMITGDMKATSAQPLSVIKWTCGGGGPETGNIPSCPDPKQSIRASVNFPSCWNGKTLDSADHKSHMAFAGKNGACPATHPVSLPQVDMEIDYENNTGGSSYTLASGGQYSMHADFFAAWDQRVQNALVASCLNTARDCTDITRDEDNPNFLYKPDYDPGPIPRIDLTKFSADAPFTGDQTSAAPAAGATPGMDHSTMNHGSVESASTTAVQTAAEEQPDTLPQTGLGSAVMGVIGIVLIGFVVYLYRSYKEKLF